MVRNIKNEYCCGCHACRTACLVSCIEMAADNEGFFYLQVNKLLYTDCGICKKVGPILRTPQQRAAPDAFAAWHRDATVRAKSSLGGWQTLQYRGVRHQGRFR
jgi:ferredoxin